MTTQEAFSAFCDRHYASVLRALTLTLRDEGLAADCLQEAMVRAYRRRREIGAWHNPAGWLYRVGLNIARSRLRRTRREVLGLVRDRSLRAPEPPDPALAAALEELSVEHRAVIVLRYWLDWTVEQTAEALDVAPGTVKSRQHRALTALRERLEVTP